LLISCLQKRQEIARSPAKYFATKDPDIIEEAYKGFAPLFPKIPYVTDEAIRSASSVTDHPKAATADPKMLYDNRFRHEPGKQPLRQRTVRQQVTGVRLIEPRSHPHRRRIDGKKQFALLEHWPALPA
jgi:hypothetical protein